MLANNVANYQILQVKLQYFNTIQQDLTLPYMGEELLMSVKREDLCPSGSYKDRLVSVHLAELLDKYDQVVVHSSGNFAISCLYYARELALGHKLVIYINDDLPEEKLAKLESLAEKSKLIRSKRPKSDAIKYAKNQENAFLFRGSVGEDYPNSYFSLAEEIVRQSKDYDALIIAASSATAAVGIMRYFKQNDVKMPVYLVQTSHVSAIAKEYDPGVAYEPETLANAISDNIAKRKAEARDLIQTLGGAAVVVTNKQIEEATNIINSQELKEQGLTPGIGYSKFTGNAALVFAGFFKLRQKGYNFSKPLLILSGN